jgi:hypothetical protein
MQNSKERSKHCSKTKQGIGISLKRQKIKEEHHHDKHMKESQKILYLNLMN